MSESQLRRERSKKLIVGVGGGFNDHLPHIETLEEARIRTATLVAKRALCLITVAACGSGELDNKEVIAWATEQSFSDEFSIREKEFLLAGGVSDDLDFMSWQIEAAFPLIWALRGNFVLGTETSQVDVGKVLDAIPKIGANTSKYISSAELRATNEILDESDLVYCIHWAVVDRRLGGTPVPEDWSSDVIMERHKALNWLTCYGDEDGEDNDWDDVGTDT